MNSDLGNTADIDMLIYSVIYSQAWFVYLGKTWQIIGYDVYTLYISHKFPQIFILGFLKSRGHNFKKLLYFIILNYPGSCCTATSMRLMALFFVGFVSSCFSGSFSQEGCRFSAPDHPQGRLMSPVLPDHYITCSPLQCCPLAVPPLETLGWPLLRSHHEIVC